MKICVLACAAATALFSLSATTQAAECVVDAVLETNKQLAFDALDGIFNKKDPGAIDRYLGPTYLQHNPGAADGTDGLKAFLPFLPADAGYEIGLLAAEDDLVWVHSRSGGAVNRSIVVDVYRVKDGRLVEHWDYVQAEVLQTVSGRPMFPITASAPEAPISTAKRCGEAPVAACVTKADLEANKALAAAALDAFFNKKDVSAVDKYVGAEYLQHNPFAGDGPEVLKGLIAALPSSATFELGAQVANDNLVWTQGRFSGIPGQNTSIAIDIFRVKDGKIVEHWDVVQQETPANQTVSGRPMFPIEPCPTQRRTVGNYISSLLGESKGGSHLCILDDLIRMLQPLRLVGKTLCYAYSNEDAFTGATTARKSRTYFCLVRLHLVLREVPVLLDLATPDAEDVDLDGRVLARDAAEATLGPDQVVVGNLRAELERRAARERGDETFC